MLTVETVTVVRRGYYPGRLGRAYCTRPGCEPSEHPGFFHTSALDGDCDRCGEPLETAPGVEITGTALVEHIPCKIF